MNKKIFISALTFFVFFLVPVFSLAQPIIERETILSRMKKNVIESGINLTDATPEQAIGLILKSLLGFLGLLFFILIIYGGILWMTSAGNEDKVSRARQLIAAAVVGIGIVLIAYLVTVLVISVLTPMT